MSGRGRPAPSPTARSVRTAAIVRIATLTSCTAVAVGVFGSGCGGEDPRELFVRPADSGVDADATDALAPEVDPTLGGPCTEDAQCDDALACTFDRCDKAILRCRNTPDDSLCADPLHCNGRERCVLRLGCAPGPVVTCQDDDPCTIDRCVEATKGCERKPRDLDSDGDPDDHCVGKRDCDDLDPYVSSTQPEVCGNFKDDDCDGQIDEAGCQAAQHDVCETALAVSAPGTYLMSTAAAKRDFVTACTVKAPPASRDVVVTVTVPAGAAGPQDVEIWATTPSVAGATNEVSVLLRGTCTQADTESGCSYIPASSSARSIRRGVAPGEKVSAIVTTQTGGPVDVKVDMRAATSAPTNETCAAPQPVAVDTPFVVALIDPARDLPTACSEAKTGDLTYSFVIPGSEPRDVKIFASTLVGGGEPVVSLLSDAACTSELRCRAMPVPPLFARGLAPGVPHVFTVSGTRHIDASILVKTYPKTDPPPNQSCATAPPIAHNATIAVDLSAQEDAIKNGCLPGGPAAAYELTLTQPSDVLVIGRFPTNEQGAVSLNGPGCTTGDLLACSPGATPQRVSKRNLPAGSYRVVVADQLGQTAQLTVLVRPAVPPTSVGLSESCAAPFLLPGAGGYFVGDTTNSTAEFDAGCDAPGQPISGAKDQIMKLELADPRRVVLDMSGSVYTTILDVRRGATCPGTEVPNACYVGLNPSRSFLDLTLAAGTYWVQVDGYNGDRGRWNLDMRVLPP